MAQTLLQKTLKLLEKSQLTRRQVALGAGVGEDWLKKVQLGKIPDPGVRRVQRVHDFLVAVKRRKK